MRSTGLVLTAGAIAAANEALFAPAAAGKPFSATFNWRLIPATALLALTLAGLERASPPLGTGLAGLVLLAVLVIPSGNARTPLENVAASIGV